jgi:hypothetical protein
MCGGWSRLAQEKVSHDQSLAKLAEAEKNANGTKARLEALQEEKRMAATEADREVGMDGMDGGYSATVTAALGPQGSSATAGFTVLFIIGPGSVQPLIIDWISATSATRMVWV